jgi:hypothetical protein
VTLNRKYWKIVDSEEGSIRFFVTACSPLNVDTVHDICVQKINYTTVVVEDMVPPIAQNTGSEWGAIRQLSVSQSNGIFISVLGDFNVKRLVSVKVHYFCHSNCETCLLNNDANSCLTCPTSRHKIGT